MKRGLFSLIRRWLPKLRFTALSLVGVTVGIFIATAAAALAYNFVPPPAARWVGTIAAYVALFLVTACLLMDRRRARQ